VKRAEFSPDSKSVVTVASYNEAARIWPLLLMAPTCAERMFAAPVSPVLNPLLM
jgi:hypothetical protein